MSDARPSRSSVTGRALLACAVVALVAAAVTIGRALPGDAPDATLEAAAIAASTLPDTIPPTVERDDGGAPADANNGIDTGTSIDTGTDTSGSPSSTLSTSPLAAQLPPRGSAIPAPPVTRNAPVTITIDGLDLWAPVRDVGLDESGEMEIPDETEVGWYELGAAPGEEGATVLAAHVTWNDTVGPFHRLGTLDPGAEVRVRLADGSTRIYEVIERTMYPKDGLPNRRIFRRSGDESLVLITCGGSFNPEIRRYRENIVVYAVPIGATTDPGG